MKQIINELFRLPMKPKLKNHLRNNLGLVGDELKIINSLLDHDGTSQFHYDNTNLSKRAFEEHLKIVVRTIITELLRLSYDNLENE